MNHIELNNIAKAALSKALSLGANITVNLTNPQTQSNLLMRHNLLILGLNAALKSLELKPTYLEPYLILAKINLLLGDSSWAYVYLSRLLQNFNSIDLETLFEIWQILESLLAVLPNDTLATYLRIQLFQLHGDQIVTHLFPSSSGSTKSESKDVKTETKSETKYSAQSSSSTIESKPKNSVQLQLLNEAEQLGIQNQYRAALENYAKVLLLDSKNVIALFNIGILLMSVGQNKLARGFFQLVINLTPDDSDAHFYLGLACIHSNALEDSVQFFSNTIQLDPKYALAYYNRAYVQQLTNPRAALKDLDSYLQLEDKDADAHYLQGEIYFVLKDLPRATWFLQQALGLDPNHLLAQNTFDKLTTVLTRTPHTQPAENKDEKSNTTSKDSKSETAQSTSNQSEIKNEQKPATLSIIDFNNFLNLIGWGTYSALYRYTWQSKIIVIKYFRNKIHGINSSRLKYEERVLKNFDSPYVIKYYGSSEQPPCLALEWAPRGSFYSMIMSQNLSWDIRLQLLRDTANGLAYIHNRGIIHCDLTPRNIVVTADYHAKLCDFGLSISKSHPQEATGTRGYRAPETYPEKAVNDEASDIFSFAVIMWAAASDTTSIRNYHKQSEDVVVQKLKNGERPQPPVPKESPKGLAELIDLCWHQNPKQRPSAVQVVSGLENIIKQQSSQPVPNYF